ncbi:MAG: hypothetical protein ACYSYV_03955 [Planctomycetota bacterium]|jgi:hypothetical protein
MKNVTVIGVIMTALLVVNPVRAADCEIVNGSLEDDGWITNIESRDPNGWESDMSPVKFGGYVYTDWATDGIYSLTLHSDWAAFSAGDMATVSQNVNLLDVALITFDIKLDTESAYTKWDPNICTAVLLIDGDVVWDSNSAGQDSKGEYFDQTYVVEDRHRNDQLHKLSLGIQVHVDEMLWERYYIYWDSIECTLFCGGGGLLAGDFNRDCYVDVNDLKLAADVWLNEVNSDNRVNLFQGDDLAGYGTIDFPDFAIFAEGWDGDAADLGMFAQKWLNEVALDDQYNLFKDDDVEPKGIVDFSDFSMFADNWRSTSNEQME